MNRTPADLRVVVGMRRIVDAHVNLLAVFIGFGASSKLIRKTGQYRSCFNTGLLKIRPQDGELPLQKRFQDIASDTWILFNAACAVTIPIFAVGQIDAHMKSL